MSSSTERSVRPNGPVPEIFFAEDPTGTCLIDESGGVPLAGLGLPESLQIIEAWWRHHYQRYLDATAVRTRRAEIRLVHSSRGPAV